MCPVLEYNSSVWDPQGVVLQEELESVLKHAAKFVTGNYNLDCITPSDYSRLEIINPLFCYAIREENFLIIPSHFTFINKYYLVFLCCSFRVSF